MEIYLLVIFIALLSYNWYGNRVKEIKLPLRENHKFLFHIKMYWQVKLI